MDAKPNSGSQAEDTAGYEPPEVTVIGTVEELTRGGKGGPQGPEPSRV
jgi:hypothetical protein